MVAPNICKIFGEISNMYKNVCDLSFSAFLYYCYVACVVCPCLFYISFYVMPLHFFCSTSTITGSRYCEHFHDGQYRLVSFLFAVILLMVSSHL